MVTTFTIFGILSLCQALGTLSQTSVKQPRRCCSRGFGGFKLLADGTACSLQWFMELREGNKLLQCLIPLQSTGPKLQLHGIWILLHHFQGKQQFPLPPPPNTVRARPPKPTIDYIVLYWINEKRFLKGQPNILLWLGLLYSYFTVKFCIYKIVHKHNIKHRWQFMSHLATDKVIKKNMELDFPIYWRGLSMLRRYMKKGYLPSILLSSKY